MHISGKIFLFLAIAGAMASAAFMAQMMTVRNSWMKANNELKEANEQNAESIAKQEAELENLQGELDLALLNWGTPINGFDMTQANPGAVRVAIGAVNGVVDGQSRQPPGENPVLHAFRPAEDGSGFVYVGPLKVQAVADNETDMIPTWSVRPGEIDPWNQQNRFWRVWQRVPSAGVTRFTDLQQEIFAADERLASKNSYLAIQQQLLDDAKQQNQVRMQELLGPAQPIPIPPDLDGVEFSHGLLAAIAAEEEARNELQADIDQLRRKLKSAFARLEGTSKDNDALIKELPAPAVTSTNATPTKVSATP